MRSTILKKKKKEGGSCVVSLARPDSTLRCLPSTVSQNNPNHYHLSTLKLYTWSTYRTNHTHLTLGQAKLGWGVKEGRKRLVRRND